MLLRSTKKEMFFSFSWFVLCCWGISITLPKSRTWIIVNFLNTSTTTALLKQTHTHKLSTDNPKGSHFSDWNTPSISISGYALCPQVCLLLRNASRCRLKENLIVFRSDSGRCCSPAFLGNARRQWSRQWSRPVVCRMSPLRCWFWCLSLSVILLHIQHGLRHLGDGKLLLQEQEERSQGVKHIFFKLTLELCDGATVGIQ